MVRKNVTRALEFLDAIEKGGGSTTRMEFLQLTKNNEANLNRMLKKLISNWKWIQETETNGRKRYTKTETGEFWYKALKAHDDLEGIIQELNGSRLSSDEERTLPD